MRVQVPDRRQIRVRHLVPAFVVAGMAVVGLVTSAASGDSPRSAAGPPAGAISTPTTPVPAASLARPSASLARPSVRSPITYRTPTAIGQGGALYQTNCSSCHGPAAGGSSVAPSLQGVGAATIDFWVSTGRMPLANAATQATRKVPRFDRQQTLAIVAYVTSQGPNYGPGIPSVDTKSASLPEGESMFVLNCAACHTITGSGDALGNGAYAPNLHEATATQVAEAIRTGPGNMPRFGPGQLSDKQVADVVAYVTGPIKHPDNIGGLGLGGIGPVAEGFVALLFGVGVMMLMAFWLGERA